MSDKLGAPIQAPNNWALERCAEAAKRLAEADDRLGDWEDYAVRVHAIVNRTGVLPEQVEKVLGELSMWEVTNL